MVNDMASDTRGIRFDSHTGQIGHSVADTRHRCDVFLRSFLFVLPGGKVAEMGPVKS